MYHSCLKWFIGTCLYLLQECRTKENLTKNSPVCLKSLSSTSVSTEFLLQLLSHLVSILTAVHRGTAYTLCHLDIIDNYIIWAQTFPATEMCLVSKSVVCVKSAMVWSHANLPFIKTIISTNKHNRFAKLMNMRWILFHYSLNACPTCVSEELGGLQHLFCVHSRFIIVHFRRDYMDNSGSTASNSPGSAIQTINILLLKSDDTLIHILQDVVLWENKTMMQLAVYIFYYSNTWLQTCQQPAWVQWDVCGCLA